MWLLCLYLILDWRLVWFDVIVIYYGVLWCLLILFDLGCLVDLIGWLFACLLFVVLVCCVYLLYLGLRLELGLLCWFDLHVDCLITC